jgi:hypothetical protein
MRVHFGDLDTDDGPVQEGWQRISSPGPRLGYLLAGLVGLAVPNALCVWLGVVSWFRERYEIEPAAVEAQAPWGAVVLALLLLIPLHELAHAVWHPDGVRSPRTMLVVWPARLRFGVYYQGQMTRRRWLLMRLAPLLCWSLIPAALLTLFQFVPAGRGVETFLEVLMVVNGIGSGGDVLAALWVARRVPRRAQIGFWGGKAYWRAGL